MTLSLESAIIFYDLRSIQRVAKRDPKRYISALRVLCGEVPCNKFDPLYFFYLKDFSGKSFLVNPQALLDNTFFYSAKDIAEYVALASYRNYSHYATTGDTSLDLFHSPVSQDIINKNRLLSIENDKVLFKFEEVTKENI